MIPWVGGGADCWKINAKSKGSGSLISAGIFVVQIAKQCSINQLLLPVSSPAQPWVANRELLTQRRYF